MDELTLSGLSLSQVTLKIALFILSHTSVSSDGLYLWLITIYNGVEDDRKKTFPKNGHPRLLLSII